MQASASTLVSQRWTIFCSIAWKLIWINFGTQLKVRHRRISNKKNGVCNDSFSIRQLLVLKNDKMWAFLTEVKYVSLTLPYYKPSFCIGFQILNICSKMLGALAVWQFWKKWVSQIKYGWNVAGSNKKVIEMEKSQKKHTFSFKALFFHFFENVNFWISPGLSCCRCN